MNSVVRAVQSTIRQHALLAPGQKVVVGVSGGPDSVALLDILRSLPEQPLELIVAHLNHQLRGQAADADAEFVSALAEQWQLPHIVETRDVAALAHAEHLSIEEAARHARYAFLARVAQDNQAQAIAVAHNADDQVETVLMHLLRGAGLGGLRGMRYKTDDAVPVVRPLLDVPRAGIESYCRERNLPFRIDETNLDTRMFRNRLRHEALPYLATLNPNVRQLFLRMSHSLADDYDVLQAHVNEAFHLVARERQGAVFFSRVGWAELHPSLQRGTLRLAVQELRQNLRDVDWTHIEDARKIALEKETGAQATLPGELMLTLGYDEFVIAKPDYRSPANVPLLNVDALALAVPGLTELPGTDWRVRTEISEKARGTMSRWSAEYDLARCPGSLALRGRRAGDRFQPAGMGGHTRSLHEYMIDEKIPRPLRDRLPLLVAGEQIVWVCGWRADARFVVTSATTRVLRVSFEKKDAGGTD